MKIDRNHLIKAHTDLEIIQMLDNLRIQNDLSIEEFTEGIVSRRNYSRYLNGEVRMSFTILAALLKKINLSVSAFSYYVLNTMIVTYNHEFEFLNHLTNRQYKEAQKIYEQKIHGQQLHTFLADKTIPAGFVYLEYKLNKISFEKGRNTLINTYPLNEVLDRILITEDDIMSLYFYTKFANKEESLRIAQFVYDLLVSNKRKNFAIHVEEAQYIAYMIALEILYKYYEQIKNGKKHFEMCITRALDFDRRARVGNYNLFILEPIYKYAKSQNCKDLDLVIYYYVTALLAADKDLAFSEPFELHKEDYEQYLTYLQDDKYLEMEMYGGLINNDYL